MNPKEKEYCILIGKAIRKLRIEKAKKSLNIFAYENDISSSTLSRIEIGETEPGIVNIAKIAYGFNMDIPEFFNQISKYIPKDFNMFDE